MGKTSRNKGKVGERELAKKLRELGFDARRGQQFCGANGDADVVGLPNIHIECKRVEALRLYDALRDKAFRGPWHREPAYGASRNIPLIDITCELLLRT